MWTSVVVAGLLALAPGQDDAIKITHARFTYGPFGMVRPNAKFLRGDVAFLAYNIENASVDKTTRKVVYALVMELRDSKGKLIFKKDNSNVETFNALDSPVQPSYLEYGIDQERAPGKYILKLTVTDRITKKKDTLTQEFEVLKDAFGFIRIGYPPAPVANLMGPAYSFNFTLVGFKRDAKKLPSLSVKMDIVDDKGKSTLLGRKITMSIPKDLGEDTKPEDITDHLGFPVNFPLNRAGKFTIKVEATDLLAQKTVHLDYNITVLDPRKYESSKSSEK